MGEEPSLSIVDTLRSETPVKPVKRFWDNDLTKINITPILLSGAAALSWDNKQNIRAIRKRFIPTFQNRFDDYIQYSPAAIAFGLKAAGVKGRNEFARSLITYTTSAVIMGIIVNGIKYTSKEERPDGSSKNSFHQDIQPWHLQTQHF